MKRFDDGSVLLTAAEAAQVAQILTLGDKMPCFSEEHIQIRNAVDHLDDLGVSAEELNGVLDRRHQIG